MTVPSSLPILTPTLLRQGQSLRADVQRAASEMTSGLASDTGAALRGDFAGLAGIDRGLAALTSHTGVANELSLLADAMQSGLATIDAATARMAERIVATATLATDGQLSELAGAAAQTLHQAIGILNTSVSGLALFSGKQSDVAPLPPADDLIDALETAIAGVSTPEDARAAIHDWFDSPAGYAALYAGGPPRAALPVAAGESVRLDVTAGDSGIRDTLEGLATMALVERGLFAGNIAARRALTLAAGETMLASGETRTATAARIGLAQERIDNARSRNEAEKTALEVSRLALTAVDPYEAATRLKDLEARLDGFYLLTARLSRLSLAEYLR